MAIKKVARPKQKPTGSMKRFLDANKVETVLLGPIERMLLAEVDTDRAQHVIHPSEMAKRDWCPLATYYRLVAIEEGKPWVREVNTMQQETIFAEGHEYHRKWQEWATRLGVLEGIWGCPSCGHEWWAKAPRACARCNYVGQRVPGRYTNLTYKEVPLWDEATNIAGHSDGQAEDRLIEIKSIGLGTVRLEVPALVRRYTLKVPDEGGTERTIVDHDRLWKDIKRPFPSHLTQGWIYLELKRRMGDPLAEIVYLYEYKPNSARKEFIVAANPDEVAPLFETAADIMHAVKKRRPPACPQDGCKQCLAYETGALNEHSERADDEPAAADGAGTAAAPRPPDAEGGPRDADGPVRRGVADPARPARRVGGLRGRRVRSG